MNVGHSLRIAHEDQACPSVRLERHSFDTPSLLREPSRGKVRPLKSTTSKITAFLALVGMFALLADTSEAGWRRRGSSGSYGSSGSSGSYGSSGSSGSWGSRGSRGHRWRHRHHSSGSWGSSGSSGYHSSGSYGSHGSSGSSGYVVRYSSCHVIHYSTPVIHSTPVIQSPPVIYTAPVTPTVTRRAAPAQSPARIKMDLPEDAIVYLVGQRMTLTGQQRTYRLPNLPEGKIYNYPIKVEIVRDGETVSVDYSESVSAGVTSSLLVFEQAGQLIVKQGSAERLVAEAR